MDNFFPCDSHRKCEVLPMVSAPTAPDRDLNDRDLYLNREINWIDFNVKVLKEALDPAVPLLEQLKFLAIFFNNLDEFFMVRVSGILKQYRNRVAGSSPDGLSCPRSPRPRRTGSRPSARA